eukprot:TRINITY_DN23211_c0_g1_i1.p1 TRINITY_DN23211_c0_g1~~TRINITY_DN23211_c0_g1_i1.p1  ORF type:complete len:308 (+),score=63.06 TRINITY_DN23211_c0_g1_i1:108-1031(+)
MAPHGPGMMPGPQQMWPHPMPPSRYAGAGGMPPPGRGFAPPGYHPGGMPPPMGPYGMPGPGPMHMGGMDQQRPAPGPWPQQRPNRPLPPANPSAQLQSKYDAIIQAPPPWPAQAVPPEGLRPEERDSVALAQGRTHWGVAKLPEEGAAPGETQEWKEMSPGDARVYQGYSGPAATDTNSQMKAKRLMDIYERVMSRPPAGHNMDPRAEVPCKFWAAGKFCKYGDGCAWSHAGPRGGGGFFFQKGDPRSSIACTFHLQGRCLRGAACPFSHKGAAAAAAPAAAAAAPERRVMSTPPEGSNYVGYIPPE